ncbi:MAG: aminotransferase class V-fold PLP-dependent enzyme [Thermogutta sp.]
MREARPDAGRDGAAMTQDGFATGECVSAEETRRRFRARMPVADRFAYFDHAAVAPLPQPVGDAIRRWCEEATAYGDLRWPRWAEEVELLRTEAAALVNAAPEEIGLVRNTSHGIGIVAEGFPWKEGDNVVFPADEFPSNQYPWLALARRGVEARRVPLRDGRLELADLEAACDRRTQILAVSWVSYWSGRRWDPAELAALAHRTGALLFLDAIQGLGVFPLDVHEAEIDFLAADGHKWLLGPEGAGLFYCRREHLDRLNPTGVGWNSVVHAMRFDHIEPNWKPSAARFEGGSQNMAGMIGLRAAVGLLRQLGIATIADAVLRFTDHACERLRQLGAEIVSDRRAGTASGIVTFTLPGADPDDVRRRCAAAGVVLSCRAGRLRISPHAYNDESDLDRLIAVLRECRRSA